MNLNSWRMDLKSRTVILLLFVALLAMSIVWLVMQVSESVPFLVPIIIVGSFVIASVIVYKTSYKPFQPPYQHKSVYTVRRIERALASGAATALVIGFITKSLQPLLPRSFGVIYLVILFVIGAIIGDALDYR